jgi:hypothetical protein
METLEQSDYRRFVRTAAAEMRRVFASAEVFTVDFGSAWYVCRERGVCGNTFEVDAEGSALSG